jgi:hypothetical protein
MILKSGKQSKAKKLKMKKKIDQSKFDSIRSRKLFCAD